MSDDADRTEEALEVLTDARVAQIRSRAAEIPKGSPGICGYCDNESGRLVNGACAPCRDHLSLP